MAFKKKTWLNVPDPNNLPEIPEGQDSLALFDADNMNRIEQGIVDLEDKIEQDVTDLENKDADLEKLIRLNNFSNLVVQKIDTSGTWIAPKAVNQLFRVFCVGAGGSGGNNHQLNPAKDDEYYIVGGGGGGGGYVEIADIQIPSDTNVDIICGAGGNASDGGVTYFGDFLSANGGKKGTDATSSAAGNGGNGGSGGGGGGCGGYNSNYYPTIMPGNGGSGDKYGGGGGGGVNNILSNKTVRLIGNGGTSLGCGNGGTYGVEPIDGKRFDGSWLSVLLKDILNCYGSKGDTDIGYGGNGGNGGCGGSGGAGGSGGGGGYCGNGGTGWYNGGGGGGGYYGNGGSPKVVNEVAGIGGGGGGGFFCDGGQGHDATILGGGGGGGFFCDGNDGIKGGSGGNGGVLIMYIKED